MEFSEENDRREGEWEEVVRGNRIGKVSRPKCKQRPSSGRTKSEGREGEEKEPKGGLMNVVVRFEGEEGVKKIDPLKLSKVIRRQVGEVKYARVLGDGNLLIGCSTEAQMEKAKKMSNIGKIKVSKVVRVGEQRAGGCKGVISGLPFSVSMPV